jgi:diaminohydroxyphosphoribosylaminopyrimidine deaminase/5-amino-6-(5-phosphoribosylamino)uracil reductase
MIVTAGSAATELRAAGCEVLELPAEAGRVPVPVLMNELGRQRMTNVLIEGGSGVLGTFLDARAFDEVHVFISPKLIGGSEGKTPIGGCGMERIAEAILLASWNVEMIDGDLYVRGERGTEYPRQSL